VSDSNEIACNTGLRPQTSAGLPPLPGWIPPPTAATQPTRPTSGDPRVSTASPVRNDYLTTVGSPAVAAARAPMVPDPYPVRPSSGGRAPCRPTTRTDRSRHFGDEVEVDLPEVPNLDDLISQAELEELAALDRQRKLIDEERKARRKSILDRLENGGVVQPGRYQAKRNESRSPHLTLGNLKDLYGEDFVSELRENLPVKRYVGLKILESKQSQAPRGWGSG
jgi:hypothetical protein